jgi:hypothetical protein
MAGHAAAYMTECASCSILRFFDRIVVGHRIIVGRRFLIRRRLVARTRLARNLVIVEWWHHLLRLTQATKILRTVTVIIDAYQQACRSIFHWIGLPARV